MRRRETPFPFAAGAIALLGALLAGASMLAPAPALAQMPGMLDPDPDMPMKEGFDLGRVILWETRNFDPLRDPEWTSLQGARRAGNVADDTPVVVFEVAGKTLVLVSSSMSYHHVAQGEMEGEPWMVTF